MLKTTGGFVRRTFVTYQTALVSETNAVWYINITTHSVKKSKTHEYPITRK